MIPWPTTVKKTSRGINYPLKKVVKASPDK